MEMLSSVAGSVLGFLSGVAIHFRLSNPLIIAMFATLAVVVGFLFVLVVVSFGLGPARIRPQ
jgi:hypothetical protein